jgi:hypothetical protein
VASAARAFVALEWSEKSFGRAKGAPRWSMLERYLFSGAAVFPKRFAKHHSNPARVAKRSRRVDMQFFRPC